MKKEATPIFQPGQTGSAKDGLFGVPTSAAQSRIHLLPVPWEVTTSYGKGTAQGPKAILEASPQIDLFDLELGNAFQAGYHMLPISKKWVALNRKLNVDALKIRDLLEEKGALSAALKKKQALINKECGALNAWVKEFAKGCFQSKKIPAVIGGDHSSPEGLIEASAEQYKDFGVLHIDAHADLRVAYQGFEHSHASIMYNVMNKAAKPKKLIQVGIRDFSEEEYMLTQSRPDIKTFFDGDLKNMQYEGQSWKKICEGILKELPQHIHISFDIDGLDPVLCPNTGTPVPGGLSFTEANYLIGSVAKSGRKIVSFDLNEVAPSKDSEWDGNVGARLLYKLCGWTVLSQKN